MKQTSAPLLRAWKAAMRITAIPARCLPISISENALYSADYDAWREVYSTLSENVRADLRANNDYWARFETPAADVSEKVYESFLQTYGDDRGMQSYGACVDLLTVYYLDTE